MSKSFRKPAVAAAIVGGVLAVSGTAAFAYWTAMGTGSGTASTAAASNNLTISQSTYAGSALVPGGTAQSVSGTIANSNPFAAPIASFTASVSVDATHATAGCLASWYAVTNLSTGATVPANGSVPFSGKVALTDDPSTNQDACKGATITLSYSVS